jgi:hypothetical protein
MLEIAVTLFICHVASSDCRSYQLGERYSSVEECDRAAELKISNVRDSLRDLGFEVRGVTCGVPADG